MGIVSSKITQSTIYQLLLDPVFSRLGYSNFDKSYGRRSIKYSIPLTLRDFVIEFNHCLDKKGNLVQFITIFDPSLPVLCELVRVHGMGDYSARFLKYAHLYVNKGFRLHLMDLPGHGHSDGVHCYFQVDECVEALREVLEEVKCKYSTTNKKMFLMGCSLGGMVVLKYSLKHVSGKKNSNINGINLHCPCIKVNNKAKPPKPIITIGKLFNLLIPRVPAIPRLKNMCSLDPQIDQNFINDPLTYHGGLRIGSGFSLLNTSETFSKDLKNLDLPFLVQQGETDRMVDPSGAQVLMDMSSSLDKSAIMYRECEHDMYTEKCGKEVFKDSIQWFLKRAINNKP